MHAIYHPCAHSLPNTSLQRFQKKNYPSHDTIQLAPLNFVSHGQNLVGLNNSVRIDDVSGAMAKFATRHFIAFRSPWSRMEC